MSAPAVRYTSALPRVLFVDQSGQLGGAEFALLQLAEHCRSHSEVVLLADGPFRMRLEALGARVQVINDAKVWASPASVGFELLARAAGHRAAGPRSCGTRARVRRTVRQHAESACAGRAWQGAVSQACGLVSTRHPHARAFGPGATERHQVAVRLAVDHVIVNSQASARSLAALTGLAADSVPVVYNGIDASAFNRVDGTDIGSLRQRLGLPENDGLPVCSAASRRGKVSTLRSTRWRDCPMHTSFWSAHRYLVRMPMRSVCATTRTALGIAERVHFAGFQDDVPTWMKAMNVILHTSTEPEPFGRVIVEGMAAGRPVIAAAAGGVTEIVRHGRNGWLVKPGDAAALAEAIVALRADPALAQRLAQQALTDAQAEFSVERYLQRMMDALTAAMQRPGDRTNTQTSRENACRC